MSNVVLVGSPRPDSTTLRAARGIADALFDGEVDEVLDIVTLGGVLFAQVHDVLDSAIDQVSEATRLVVASPTYKGAYTGLLKLFLDRLPGGALEGTTAFPIMLGAGPHHAMAPELTLRPVLVELGASCPVRGLFLTEDEVAAGAMPTEWLTRARRYAGTHHGGDHDAPSADRA